MKTEIFNYNENPVTFKLENGELMVSATEMARPFGKRPNDYLNLPSTQELIEAITRKNGNANNQLVTIVRGGFTPGTWLHESIAIDFAQWISIDFKLWCNDKIRELLSNGVTTVSDDDEILAQAIEVLKKRVQQKTLENQELEKELSIATPKAEYYDEVMMCDGCYTTTLIAKELGMSAVSLNEVLSDLKIHFKQSGVWLLYAKYQDKGYTKTHTHIYTQCDGRERSRLITVWTEEGREFIHKLIKKIRRCGNLIE